MPPTPKLGSMLPSGSTLTRKSVMSSGADSIPATATIVLPSGAGAIAVVWSRSNGDPISAKPSPEKVGSGSDGRAAAALAAPEVRAAISTAAATKPDLCNLTQRRISASAAPARGDGLMSLATLQMHTEILFLNVILDI